MKVSSRRTEPLFTARRPARSARLERPPQSFLDSLQSRGVSTVSAGEVIVATWHPFETQVLEAIRDSGLELQIIFNKDAVMVLPPESTR